MPDDLERSAEQSLATEDEQQRQPGDRWRQDDRQVDGGLDQARAAERAAGQQIGERGPRMIVRTRLTAVVTMLRRSASRTTGLVSASHSPPASSDRPTRAMTGTVRNRTSGRLRTARARPGRPCWAAVTPAVTAEAERREDRLAVRAGQPGQERLRRVLVLRRLDDDPGICRRHVRVVGDGDDRDLGRPLGVGHVDDGGVAVARLDLGQDRGDVVFLRHDVRGVGRGEIGRIAGLRRRGSRRAGWRTS